MAEGEHSLEDPDASMRATDSQGAFFDQARLHRKRGRAQTGEFPQAATGRFVPHVMGDPPRQELSGGTETPPGGGEAAGEGKSPSGTSARPKSECSGQQELRHTGPTGRPELSPQHLAADPPAPEQGSGRQKRVTFAVERGLSLGGEAGDPPAAVSRPPGILLGKRSSEAVARGDTWKKKVCRPSGEGVEDAERGDHRINSAATPCVTTQLQLQGNRPGEGGGRDSGGQRRFEGGGGGRRRSDG